MFAQQIRKVGLTVAAAAFVVTTLVTAIPASAAPIGPSPDREYLKFYPDVSVTGIGINGSDISYWTAAFEITNKMAPANNIRLNSFCMYRDPFHLNVDTTLKVSDLSLPANQQVPVPQAVNCPGRAKEGLALYNVKMFAYVPVGDSNESNNTADVHP